MRKKILAFLMAMLLVVMIMPTAAFASEENYATLTVIHGVDFSEPVTVVNVKYAFKEGATLLDLFKAAKEAGDIDDFSFSGSYIESITPAGGSAIANKADYSYYWANYKNGDYAQGYTDCTADDVLKSGDCFQFSYEGYPINAAPDSWASVQEDLDTASVKAGDPTNPVGGTAILSIVKGIYFGSPYVVSSMKYDFYEGATLGDLLQAACDEEEIDGYRFSYGYLDSITPYAEDAVENKADYSSYWSVYKNGGYCQGYTDGTETDLLTDGVSFEYAWEDYPAMVGLSQEKWNELSAEAKEGTETAESEKSEANKDETEVKALSQDTEKVFKSLYESLIENGKDDNGFMALAAVAAGKSDYPDKDQIMEDALAAAEDPSYSAIQTAIIMLSAIGENPEDVDGINLINILAATADAVPPWVEGPAYTLYAYASDPDAVISGLLPNAPSKLIEKLKNAQNEDGGFGYNGTSSADSTGAVLAALAGYMNNDDAEEMIPKAVDALISLQNEDGGFGYGPGAETNIDSTAQAIIGLCAVGIDPTGSEFTKGGKNPITALLSFANGDGTDLKDLPGVNMDYARSDAARALAAYSGLRNTGKAFNVYTMANTGAAKYTAPANNDVPKTSDSSKMMLYMAITFLSLTALGTVIVAKKKAE